jgi:NitT/TauT family transport system substrate-binding protein
MGKRIIRRFSILFISPLFIQVFVLLSSCGIKEPIKIGINPWPPCEIWYIAEKMGYFGDVPVKIIRFSNWSDSISSLYDGRTDLVHSTYFNSIFYYQKGVKSRIILSSDTISGSDGLVIRNTFKGIGELKGKKIAVEVNTDEHFLLKKALDKFNLSENDVTIISCTSSEAMEKFISGQADACFTYDPYLTEAAQKGGGRTAFSTVDIPGYMIDTLVASQTLIDGDPGRLTKVINAWYEALEYIRRNPDTAFGMMSQNENMNIKDFRNFFESFHFYSPMENLEMFDSDGFRSVLGEMDQFLFQHKAITNSNEIGDVFTDEIIKKIK